MITDDLVNILMNNSYIPMKTNLNDIWFFGKETGADMKVISVVNSYDLNGPDGEQLEDIAFQLERKFLLNGKKNVDVHFVIFSRDVERDRKINETNISFCIIDVDNNRLIAYENVNEKFNDIIGEIERSMAVSHYRNKQKRTVQLPYVNIIMVSINVVIFILLELRGSTNDAEYMLNCGAAQWQYIFYYGQYYRLITHMFLHFGLAHLCSNMFSLLIVGSEVEKTFGRLNYIIIYFTSGIGAGILSAVYHMKRGEFVVSAGASGAIFGVMGAVLVGMYVTNRLRGPGVGRQFLILLLMAFCSGSTNIDNMAHVGGFVTGVIVSAIISMFCYKSKRGSGG